MICLLPHAPDISIIVDDGARAKGGNRDIAHSPQQQIELSASHITASFFHFVSFHKDLHTLLAVAPALSLGQTLHKVCKGGARLNCL